MEGAAVKCNLRPCGSRRRPPSQGDTEAQGAGLGRLRVGPRVSTRREGAGVALERSTGVDRLQAASGIDLFFRRRD